MKKNKKETIDTVPLQETEKEIEEYLNQIDL